MKDQGLVHQVSGDTDQIIFCFILVTHKKNNPG